jgi:hypothetical protein
MDGQTVMEDKETHNEKVKELRCLEVNTVYL